jgi:hypothetical protein
MITEMMKENKYAKCHDYIVKKHAIGMMKSLKGIYHLYQKQQRNYIKTSLKYLIKSVKG